LTGLAPDIELPPDLRFGHVTSVADVRRVVRALLHGGADLIKVIATGAVLTRGTNPGATELTEEEIRAAVERRTRWRVRGRACPERTGSERRPGRVRSIGTDRSSTTRRSS
jgi:hypothetical protein